jgi:hypothetical protein
VTGGALREVHLCDPLLIPEPILLFSIQPFIFVFFSLFEQNQNKEKKKKKKRSRLLPPVRWGKKKRGRISFNVNNVIAEIEFVAEEALQKKKIYENEGKEGETELFPPPLSLVKMVRKSTVSKERNGKGFFFSQKSNQVTIGKKETERGNICSQRFRILRQQPPSPQVFPLRSFQPRTSHFNKNTTFCRLWCRSHGCTSSKHCNVSTWKKAQRTEQLS